MGESNDLDDKGTGVSHGCDGRETRLKMFEVSVEAGALPVSHRIVGSSCTIELAGNPEGSGGFLAAIHLPAVIQDMDAGVWRGSQYQLGFRKAANRRVRIGARGLAMKDDGGGPLLRGGSFAPFPEGPGAIEHFACQRAQLVTEFGDGGPFLAGVERPLGGAQHRTARQFFASRLAGAARRLPRLVRRLCAAARNPGSPGSGNIRCPRSRRSAFRAHAC